MARVFNGSSQYLSASSTLLTNEPIDMVSMVNSDTIASAQGAIALGNNGANGHFASALRGDVASDPAEAIKQSDAAASSGARTGVGYSLTTWYGLGSSFISDASRSVWLNGANKASDGGSISDPSPDFISIGCIRRSSAVQLFDGSLAEAYILDANMGDTVHGVCGLGYSPIWSMPISNIRGWYPLQADNNNRVAGGYPDLTASGSPTDGAHPFNVVYPRINGLITL